MNPVTSIGAAALQVSKQPVNVLRVRGNFNGSTADRWLMLFDAITTPADGTAPAIAAIPLYQSSPFFAEFEIGALAFKHGCYACVSTTQATKTLSADTMDITVELDAPELPTGASLAGDLTTGVNSLSVWATANGPKKLLKLEVDNTGGADNYIMLFATDSPSNGDTPIMQWTLAANAVLTGDKALTFGKAGFDVYSRNDTGALSKGCTIAISSTTGTLTAIVSSVPKIRAQYL